MTHEPVEPRRFLCSYLDWWANAALAMVGWVELFLRYMLGSSVACAGGFSGNTPQVRDSASASFSFDDLPLKAASESTTTHLTHALCLVTPTDGVPDLELLRQSFADGTPKPPLFEPYDLLPPHDSQHVVLPDGRVLSHLNFQTRLQISRLRALLPGDIYLVDQRNIAAQKVKILMAYMLHNLGGRVLTRCKYVAVEQSDGKRAPAQRSPEEIDAGFAFINAHAPTGFQRNQHLVWLEKQ
eukprot:6465213-Amphidinium_carterae.1